ncbi:hypothetical protein EAF07_04915 [Streptococcus hillyeri]|uniref:Uncharacterized protein n=1 Tax=Streptococcus hillyeri TaxID=2282420 RepID=A0A3L9DUN9_9STRE|nr:hypothetical protein EAF07_04915 [Streptococcus hillyeri]
MTLFKKTNGILIKAFKSDFFHQYNIKPLRNSLLDLIQDEKLGVVFLKIINKLNEYQCFFY